VAEDLRDAIVDVVDLESEHVVHIGHGGCGPAGLGHGYGAGRGGQGTGRGGERAGREQGGEGGAAGPEEQNPLCRESPSKSRHSKKRVSPVLIQGML
jgi:hypothetical protein